MAVRKLNIHTITDEDLTQAQINTIGHRILEACADLVHDTQDLVLVTIDDTVDFDGVPMPVEIPLGTVDADGVNAWPQPTQEEA